MERRTRQPSAKVQGTQGPKDASQYLADLDSLLKRNTGSGLFVGQDTSSNTPMYLPGKVQNPLGLGEIAPSIASQGNGVTQPAPVQRQPLDTTQENQPPVSIEDFLQAFEESYNSPANQPDFGNPQLEFIMSTPDGGAMLSDGTIVYEDGTIRNGDPNAEPIASDAGGGIRYSDGSIRQQAPEAIQSLAGDRERIGYSDGSARWGNYQYGQPNQSMESGGLQGLIKGIFGQDRTVTQGYGNINAMEPTPGNVNYGTDIRTRDLTGSAREIKLPVGAEVVQVLYDDGTQFGDRSGHQGYGNSILVRLNTGEMVRFSHLSQMANLQPGQRVEAGTVFGTPGTTGNTDGEHLDLEYYDASGRISDPTKFSGFSDPQGLRSPLPGQDAPGTKAPVGEIQNQSTESFQQPQQTQQSTANVPNRAVETVKAFTTMPQDLKVNLPSRKEAVEGVAKTAGINTELGLSENLNPFSKESQQARVSALSQQPKQYNPVRQLLGNVTERIGDTLGIPEGTFSEAIAGGATKRTNQAMASEIGGDAPEVVPGIRQNLKDIGSNIKQAGQNALSQAGEGLRSIGQAGLPALDNIFKPKADVAKRAVGDVAGTADQPNASLMDDAQSLVKNDIRDPFFKSGAVDSYASFLKPGAIENSGGALGLDLFNEKFFQDQNNVKNVFGGTFMQPEADKRYSAYVEEKNKKQPTLQDYLNAGKTVAQYYAETGQQSSLDSFSKQGYDPRTNTNPEGAIGFSGGNAIREPFNDSGAQMSVGPEQGVTNAIRAAASGKTYVSPSGNKIPNYSPANANMSDASTGLPVVGKQGISTAKPQSAPVKNVFSTVSSTVKNIFRR